VLTKSVALQLAKWTKVIPQQYRAKAEKILVEAARGGADLRSLAAICAEIRALTASRSSPAPAVPPPSCAASCSASPSPGRPSRSTSGSPSSHFVPVI
jgi:hypothetical protein